MFTFLLILALPLAFAAGALAAVGNPSVYAAAAAVLYWLQKNLPR